MLVSALEENKTRKRVESSREWKGVWHPIQLSSLTEVTFEPILQEITRTVVVQFTLSISLVHIQYGWWLGDSKWRKKISSGRQPLESSLVCTSQDCKEKPFNSWIQCDDKLQISFFTVLSPNTVEYFPQTRHWEVSYPQEPISPLNNTRDILLSHFTDAEDEVK